MTVMMATAVMVFAISGCSGVSVEQPALVANAGPDQTVATGSTVQLDGSRSYDPAGNKLTFSWTLITVPVGSKASLSSTTVANPTFVADLPGSYVAQLTVNDSLLVAKAKVTITANTTPVANAGPNQTVAAGSKVQLDGSKSNDPDGDGLTFSWTLITVPVGSKASLSSTTVANPTFVANLPGSYVAQLTVSDRFFSNSAKVTITTTTNLPPTAHAGPNQTVATGSVVQLDGSKSNDPDGDNLTFSWSLTAIPGKSSAVLSVTSITNPTFTADVPGTYVAQLTVSDGTLTASGRVTITANTVPVANAGPNQTVATGSTVQLDGSKSNDSDGDNLTFNWSLIKVPAGTKAAISATTVVNPTFVADVPGNYVAQLTVSDGTFSNSAAVSISAGLAGQSALLTTRSPTFWSSNNTLNVIFPISNDGSGVGGNVQVTSITLASQGVSVAPVIKPNSLPLAIGDIKAGSLALADISFAGASLISGNHYEVVISGTYQSNGSNASLSLSGDVTYGTTSVFDQPANPIDLTVSVDSTNSAAGAISADLGGTITTTAADGTVFTLTVPPNALLTDEAVTMTPVSSISGLTISGGFVAGVQLAPEGLRLFQPAKLVIQPSAQVPINQQVGFSYHETGQDYSLYPLDLVSAVSLSITHFSGYGLGSGNALASTPTDAEARLSSAIQQLIAQERQIELSGGTPDPQFGAKLEGLLQQYSDQVIQPLIQQAQIDATAGNVDSATVALAKILGFERTAQLLGFDSIAPGFSAVAQIIETLAKTNFNTSYQNCVTRGIVSPTTVGQMLEAIRDLELLGFDSSTILGANAITKVIQCANLKLSLNFDDDVSQVFSNGPAGGIGGLGFSSAESHVQANNVLLSFVPPPSKPTPGGPQGDFEVQNAPFNYLNLTYVNGTAHPAPGVTVQFCTTLVSDSSGNSISVKAWPDYNVKSGPASINVEIWNVESGEVWLVGDSVTPPGTGCMTPVPPVSVPLYKTGFIIAGGRSLFSIPLNTTQTFTLTGTYIAPIDDTATEVRTVTISVVKP